MQASQLCQPDHHLGQHFNLRRTYSLEVFPNSPINSCPLLQKWFQTAITHTHWPFEHVYDPSSTISTQGRLHCPQRLAVHCESREQFSYRKAGFILSRTSQRSLRVGSKHNIRSPRNRGQRPHAIADRPTSLTPSINPGLGVRSTHKELHRCALLRIFRPVLGIDRSD